MNLAESLGFVPQRTTRAVRAINVEKLIPNPDNFYHIGDLSDLKASILEDGGSVKTSSSNREKTGPI